VNRSIGAHLPAFCGAAWIVVTFVPSFYGSFGSKLAGTFRRIQEKILTVYIAYKQTGIQSFFLYVTRRLFPTVTMRHAE
jgi:hypothetical protein